MRMKREISFLEHDIESIELPKYSNDFARWKSKFRCVIEDNLGYQIAKTLEYCDTEQVFYVRVECSGQLLAVRERKEKSDEADNACVTLERGVTIDPRNPLAPQIEHVREVHEALKKRFRLLGEMLHKQKQGYRMKKFG